jgi:hypothetical protein
MADARETGEEPDRQRLGGVISRMDRARRQSKALPGHPTGSSGGKPGASFITRKERMIVAAEAARQPDTLMQREHALRAELHSGNDWPRECQDQDLCR